MKSVDFTTDLALNVQYYNQTEDFSQYFPNKGSCDENSPINCYFTGKDRMDSSAFFYASLNIFLLAYFAQFMFMTNYFRATLIGYCCLDKLKKNQQWTKWITCNRDDRVIYHGGLQSNWFSFQIITWTKWITWVSWFIISVVYNITEILMECFMQTFICTSNCTI